MGSNKTVLTENKFSGEEDIREFLRGFEVFVAVNEWSDQGRRKQSRAGGRAASRKRALHFPLAS